MNSGRAPEPLHAQDIHQNSCPTGMQGQVALRPVALRPVALDELIGADHLQIAAEAGFGLIVGVMVGTSGADQDALDPMHRQVAASLKRVAPNWLVDGGYVSRHGIEQVSRRGSRIHAPLGTLASQGGTAVQAWRERMNTADGRAPYRPRPDHRVGERLPAQPRAHPAQRPRPGQGARGGAPARACARRDVSGPP